ncbi:TetR/AcrR family transcriptional regulator [Arthrobacter sp. zg-Y1171]|uniref:TetR/AcrR family transcriptional regulator n=1 Tax=Arthrobacter sp. zg-Y1171 TaxID=2964610 RepID=UPI00210834C9|nr:TetR/AcrR family transcriptional regulator [Arthrobacter sp. zg-Y1171]MCQ1996269.1 TetR/AcrR family transcriptional regulator [Arthrobacter sp. zg-Y1171]UWX82681.1 TetR/AcrR family transcriptional regulator [Arthrobacter sp. zg-Y1171]
MVEKTDPQGTLPRGVLQAWGQDKPQTRPGPKAMLSIAGIAASAISLADTDGAEALSLGRIAERLGVTANALYRYVDSRDDLDVIVHDQALGAPAGIGPGEDWASAAAAWCRALRQRYERHPWLTDLRIRIPFAPNALAWLDNLLERLEPSGMSGRQALQAAGLLDGYVRARAGAERDVAREGSSADPEALVDRIGAHRFSARLPRVSALISDGHFRQAAAGADEDFEFGLAAILNGLRRLPRHDAGPRKS